MSEKKTDKKKSSIFSKKTIKKSKKKSKKSKKTKNKSNKSTKSKLKTKKKINIKKFIDNLNLNEDNSIFT